MYEILVKFINYTLYPIYSFFINVLFWIKNYKKYNTAKIKKQILKKRIRTISDIKKELKFFKWTKDDYMDWYPWVITIMAKDMRDDCDGSAYLTKWMFEQIGLKSNLVICVGKTNHMICITKDKSIVSSNNNIYFLNQDNWKEQLYNIFNGKYHSFILL